MHCNEQLTVTQCVISEVDAREACTENEALARTVELDNSGVGQNQVEVARLSTTHL